MTSLEFLTKRLTFAHKITQNVNGIYVYNDITTIESSLYFTFKHRLYENYTVYIDYYFYNLDTEEYYINFFNEREYISSNVLYDINEVINTMNSFYACLINI
jgi:hypothetical protein